MDLKETDNDIYLIGMFQPAFGGSHFSQVTSQFPNEQIPKVHEVTPKVYKALHQAVTAGLIRSAHDLSEGGLAVAAAEMCIGGRLGMKLEYNLWDDPVRVLFGESTGVLLVEVRKQGKDEFLKIFDKLPLMWIGTIMQEQILLTMFHGSIVLDISLSEIMTAWNKSP